MPRNRSPRPSIVSELVRLNPGRNLITEVLPELFAARIRETQEANPGITPRQAVDLLLRGRYKTDQEEARELEERMTNARLRREQAGRHIAATPGMIRRRGTGFEVKSSNGLRWYRIQQTEGRWVCDCPDHFMTCKHTEAVVEAIRTGKIPKTVVTKPGDFNALAREINEKFARMLEIIESIPVDNWRLREELDDSIAEARKAQQLIRRRLREFKAHRSRQ